MQQSDSTTNGDDSPQPEPTGPPRGHTWTLLGVGILLVVGGVAMVVAPEYSERAGEIAAEIERFSGLRNGVLVLAGLVFLSLGLQSGGISRLGVSARGTSASDDDGADVSLVVEQLAGDLAQLRTAVGELGNRLGANAQRLEQLVHMQEALVQSPVPSANGEPGQMDQDPLFLMASSLDKLHARLDERLNVLTDRFDERFSNPGA